MLYNTIINSGLMDVAMHVMITLIAIVISVIVLNVPTDKPLNETVDAENVAVDIFNFFIVISLAVFYFGFAVSAALAIKEMIFASTMTLAIAWFAVAVVFSAIEIVIFAKTIREYKAGNAENK